MVCRRNSKSRILGRGIEVATSHQAVKTRQHCREVLQEALSFRRRLVTGRGSNQQIIVKRVSQALQRAADSWLAQEQACSSTSGIALFREDGKDDQEIQVRLT